MNFSHKYTVSQIHYKNWSSFEFFILQSQLSEKFLWRQSYIITFILSLIVIHEFNNYANS